MAAERLSMRQIREILRQKWTLGRSHREVAGHLGAGLGTVSGVERGARHRVGLGPGRGAERRGVGGPALPAAAAAHASSARARLRAPACRAAQAGRHAASCCMWSTASSTPTATATHSSAITTGAGSSARVSVMRHAHRAGEKLLQRLLRQEAALDRPGHRRGAGGRAVRGRAGGVELHLCRSDPTQRIADWVGSHTRAVEFFQGVAALVVPDQLKSAVNQPCRYEPESNARSRSGPNTTTPWCSRRARENRATKPKSKSVSRSPSDRSWPACATRPSSALAELAARVSELLAELNARVMRRYGKSRRELFDALDRPALKPLPGAATRSR